MQLRDYQRHALQAIASGKHIVVAECGCLAKGTPVIMADNTIKSIEDVKAGDLVWSFDDSGKWIKNEVDCVFRTTQNPKPMIELSYHGETIRTTYDHPFFNGEGYYPLYQLVWGAMETSERIQLELLCKQYGQAFDDKAIRCKHSSSNEACTGQGWLLQNGDEREDSEAAQSSSPNMASKPYQLALREPYQRRQSRQQGREFGVVYIQVQCMVDDKNREGKSTNIKQKSQGDIRATHMGEGVWGEAYSWQRQYDKSETLQDIATDVPPSETLNNKTMGQPKATVYPAEPYYSLCLRTAPYTYCIGRRYNFITHNTGKTITGITWAKSTGKTRVLVVTTASVRDQGSYPAEAKQWYPNWFESLSSFEVVSWAGLAKWAQANWDSLEEYAFIYDEISSCKAGVSSIRGSAFLQITKQSDCWTGWTATPGDRWIDFYAYFVACDKIRNKTEFIREFCVEQQFRGFREIVAYRNTATLNKWWREISCQVDSSEVQKELPGMVHKTINFKKPTGYDKVLKTSTTMDGEFMDNCSAMAHYLRQLCSTKQKLEWIRDFVMNLNQPCLIFYTYNSEGEAIQSAVEQALGIKPIKISGYNGKRLKRPSKRQSARVWRIDGKSHDIPTAETIGQRDVVLAQWQAGAFGLNLQFIHYWISASPCYSYSTSIQARKRIHRIGQTHTCYYYYLLADGTIEEDIYAALKTKSDFAEDVWALAKQHEYNIKWRE